MTSPEPPEEEEPKYPSSSAGALDASGAFVIGGGPLTPDGEILGTGYGFGQGYTEELMQQLFKLPAPNMENAIELLTDQLLKLPLDALKMFKDIIPDPVEEMFEAVETAVEAIINALTDVPFKGLLNTLKLICEFLRNNPLAQCIAQLSGNAEDFIETFVQNLFGLVDTFWQLLLNNPISQCLVDWFTDLFGSSGSFLSDFTGAISYLLDELNKLINENPIINAIKDFAEDTGLLVLNILNGAVEAFQRILNMIGFPGPVEALEFLEKSLSSIWELITGGIAGIGGVVKTIEDIIEAITTWIEKIPLIGPMVKYLSQAMDGFDFTPDLAGLAQWAERLLHRDSKLPAQNLFGFLPPGIFGTIPVGTISDVRSNLLSQGEFSAESNIEAAYGWSWDGSLSKTATGGSCKTDCGGTTGTRQLYSTQNIPVAAGDKIGVSSFVRTSNFNGSSISIQIGVVAFAGRVQKSTYLLASRGGSDGTWSEVTNAASLWTVPKAANAFDQITSIQLTIAVGSSATSGTVNWDEIALWKGGLMQQGLVDSLISAWNGLIGGLLTPPGQSTPTPAFGQDWTGLVGAAAAARSQANTALSNAGTAQSTASAAASTASTANNTATAASGEANTANSKADAVHGRVTSTNNRLFGTENASGSSKIQIGALPAAELAEALGLTPSVGSGARVCRVSTSSGFNGSDAVSGIRPFGWHRSSTTTFWDTVVNHTSDISFTSSSGAFTVSYDGWYFVEIGFTVDASAGFVGGFNVAPAVLVNGSTATAKIGNDCWGSYSLGLGGKARTAQSSFIVYLNAGDYVQAGYDSAGNYTNFFKGDTNGGSPARSRSSYFSISLLNRTQEG